MDVTVAVSHCCSVSPGSWGVRLIDPDTGAELVTLDDLGQEVPVTFSPDGGQLVTYRLDGTLRLWDLRLIREELAEMGLDWSASPIPPKAITAKIDLSIAESRDSAAHH